MANLVDYSNKLSTIFQCIEMAAVEYNPWNTKKNPVFKQLPKCYSIPYLMYTNGHWRNFVFENNKKNPASSSPAVSHQKMIYDFSFQFSWLSLITFSWEPLGGKRARQMNHGAIVSAVWWLKRKVLRECWKNCVLMTKARWQVGRKKKHKKKKT